MSTSLSDTTIHLVKATVPALQEHGLAITALAGVRSNRIHYEFFGPADEILAAA
ncbi:hypothetical protein KHP60_22955 [Microvirga sp. 3-52]|jgi:ferredoxin-NADP reductase|uniref:hypothetical protein n=1 Tax=Microvirga sp. 3-52 TaxID=2792425 RepID=UPI001AD0B5BC|nr:hypothetical protein [Microvirga sp. 3-52]MBO1908717.1 hypothetical protein [Microvirga sp. 3-52]MBS7455158.1 hypothetical protein [Microvirga sp. 3-52]